MERDGRWKGWEVEGMGGGRDGRWKGWEVEGTRGGRDERDSISQEYDKHDHESCHFLFNRSCNWNEIYRSSSTKQYGTSASSKRAASPFTMSMCRSLPPPLTKSESTARSTTTAHHEAQSVIASFLLLANSLPPASSPFNPTSHQYPTPARIIHNFCPSQRV